MPSGKPVGRVTPGIEISQQRSEDEKGNRFIQIVALAFSFIGSYWTARSFGFSRSASLVLSTVVAGICLRIITCRSCQKKSLPLDKGKEEILSATPRQNDWKTQIAILSEEKPYEALRRGTKLLAEEGEHLADVRCPHYISNILPGKDTVLQVEMHGVEASVHANKIGDGILKSSMVASAYPYYPEGFWDYVFQNPSTIFDLAPNRPNKDWESPYLKLENIGDVFNFSIGQDPQRRYNVFLIDFKDSLYTYEIENIATREKRQIKRYHYKDWPDRGIIKVERLELLVQKVRELCKEENTTPWVHCVGGIGRTGCLITARALKELVETGEITNENSDSMLVNLILAFRKQRAIFFVQNEVQFLFLKEYAKFLLSRLEDC